MLSILLAYFGKGKIPNSVRLLLLIVGLTILVHRVSRIMRAHAAYEEAMIIKGEMDRRASTETTNDGSSPVKPAANGVVSA